MYPTNSVQKWCHNQDYCGLLLATIQRVKELENMSVCEEKQNIVKRSDGRYEVSVPWLVGAKLSNTHEMASKNASRTSSKNSGEMKS